MKQNGHTCGIPVIPMRLHHSIGYHTIGLFAIGTSAFGNSSRFDVKVSSDAPGPHRIRTWKPGEGNVACGMAKERVILSQCMVRSHRSHKGVCDNKYHASPAEFWL
jgi:hypothetical protein